MKNEIMGMTILQGIKKFRFLLEINKKFKYYT